MRTYLSVMFSTEGGRPSKIVERHYDFVYDWDKNATIDDTIYFADKVHETLRGQNVRFKLETEHSLEEE